MSWDPKAERIAARAAAEQARAEADRIRIQADIERQRAQAELDREQRGEKRQTAKERRKAVKDAVTKNGHQLVPAVAIGAPAVIAWNGQYEFAAQVMHLGLLSPLLPVAIEGSVLYAAMLAHQAIKAELPVGRYRAVTWGLAAVAGGLNFWHGITATGHALTAATAADYQVGGALGLTSLLGIGLLELTVALRQRATSGRSAAQIRQALVRRVRYPRLSVQAAAIAAARGIDADAAWRAAWADRYGIGPDSTRTERRIARKILARQEGAAKAAARAGELVIVDGAIVRPETERPDERSTEAPVSAQENALNAYTTGGVREIEAWLSEREDSSGGTRELPALPSAERSDTPSLSAHDDARAQGERSPEVADERQDSAPRKRSLRPGRRKASAQGGGSERLQSVRRLLTERPDMSGADIAAALTIPESTARRLRSRVLRERGEQ